jgi:hypothetical protein
LLLAKPQESELKPTVKKDGDVFKTNNPMLLLFY